jgi:tRNA 2-thiouridine synthesizing protein B
MLHIITTSPFQSSALNECLNIVADGDALLFLGEGVYVTAKSNIQIDHLDIHILQEHAEARGLPQVAWAHYIDYNRMVELTEQHHPVQTWF